MISPQTQTNLVNAGTYFREHLTSGDYYSQGKQTRGTWFGKAAEELGLRGFVEEDAFLAMCEGVDPNTGETLTARKNTTRLETHNGETKEVANRRAYYDFTLSPPKSVSVAALVGNDDRVVEAHKQAIDVAIGELETFAAVRVRKQPHHSAELLRSDWLDQLPEQERTALDTTLAKASTNGQQLNGQKPDYQKSFDWADRHHFERKSVVRDVELWTGAMRELRGTEATVAGLKEHFAARAYVRDQDRRRVTTPETLTREQQLIAMVQVGKRQYEPLLDNPYDPSPTLNDSQKKVMETLAGSRDFLTVFRGGAGTGKSFTLGELNRLLTGEGTDVVAVAPQNSQVRDLEKGGFSQVQTLASFLQGNCAKSDSVILLDEAGQVGGSDFLKLLVLAKENNCRVIASGDTRQHGAVTATDALVAIQRYAQPTVASLPATTATIQRQQAACYRKAVAAADAGLPARAFEILEGNRAVLDVTIRDKHADVAKAFCQRSGDGGSCLVVQTNAEVDLLNEAIRKELMEKNLLGGPLLRLPALRPLDLTSAQKLQPQQYTGSTFIIANRKVAGLEKNQPSRFKRASEDSIVVEDESGVEHVIRGDQVHRITVCEQKELEFRAGEQLQIKANLKTRNGLRLVNGSLVTLAGVDPETSDIEVKDRQGRLLGLDPSARMLQYGYASTSYGSQGKTVDHVLISDSQCKAATNQKEFYVLVSRGRQSVAIYTTDREALRDHVQRLGDRELALDLERECEWQRESDQ